MADSMKELVAREIAMRVKDGEVIGVGTGSTVDLALQMLGERVRSEKISVHVVPTSHQSAWTCERIGLKVLYPGYCSELAWGFDGADEVDPNLWLIKGKGGAMLQEKILASRCKEFIVIVDDSKVVTRLGEKFPVPVEVIPEALSIVEKKLPELGAEQIEIRQAVKKHGPVITEGGNIILDVNFREINPHSERDVKAIVGVVESGLFLTQATEVWVAGKSGINKRKRAKA